MGSDMPPRLRNTALRAAHSAREFLASIDVIDDAKLRDMVFTKFFPAVVSTVCPRPGVSSANDDYYYNPDLFFDNRPETYYLELIFALAINSNWRPHVFGDRHIERCISMIDYISNSYLSPWLVGILRIAPEQLSDPLLKSITEQQWYDLTIKAWPFVTGALGDLYYLEVLLILVEETKKYVHISSKKHELELVIKDSEQGERVTVAVKELMAVVRDVLDSERFSQ
ncbi:hypothetical protein DEU56DRAFT_763289 [Suillus clintonianus]|uniref:uncharacterized protein n=1 Tax=Suillus clintonianus TaxID=1904413 RepID=UPI001B87A937|nr:uncharacterized protein DEU56DRAFT_763289 [Suillus clintonianus]KAG2157156.1 hypothetical protein DEU56DRAFT_763289 [Suillus clintonianus]